MSPLPFRKRLELHTKSVPEIHYLILLEKYLSHCCKGHYPGLEFVRVDLFCLGGGNHGGRLRYSLSELRIYYTFSPNL